jgi:succinoglycan biosynthesis transport protein ExoP
MSRKGSANSGDDPYVKHVEVRPCNANGAGATRVNIAGYDFELIDPVRPPRAQLPPMEPAQERPRGGFESPDRPQGGNRILARQSTQIESLPTYEPDQESDEESGSRSGGFDLAVIHRMLRGRYIWAIVLGILLGGAGVTAGLLLGFRTYQSTGLFSVVPVTYMYDTPEKRITSYVEFVKALAAKYVTQPIIDDAMDNPIWQQVKGGRTRNEEVNFARNLQVSPEGQLLIVKFTAPEAVQAQVAVKATMQAFDSHFTTEQVDKRKSTTDALEKNSRQLTHDLEVCRQNIAEATAPLGTDGLKDQREYVLTELRRAETELAYLEIESGPGAIAPSETAADRMMQRLLDAKFDQNARLAQLDAAGVGANMPQRLAAVAYLKGIQQQIDDRKADLEGSSIEAARGPATQAATDPKKSKQARLHDRVTELKDSLKRLTETITKVDALQIQASRIQHDFEAAAESLHQRDVEDISYRLDPTWPDEPLIPYRDTRIAFSIGGGLGGILLGFGMVAMVGFMDRRVLDPNDTMNGGRRHPVLGMLPQLPENLADPEQIAIAAQGVHEIRNRLQLSSGGRPAQQVVAITGAVAGSGKTSLTLGLGLSFASAGFKTLVIDADFVGGGLSARIDKIIRGKIGQVLLHEGLVTSPQLEEALSRGKNSGRRVGEMLVQLGYVAEADLLAAIKHQGQYSVGILDAIAGDDLHECTIDTGIPNLSALPLGAATAAHAGVISGAAMQSLISRARTLFEVVLLDTGPIPGSLEASLAASNADAVVLVVARGDTRPDVERTLSYLRGLPVQFAGLVFNRARKRDIERYGSSRVSSVDALNPDADLQPVELPGSMRFGPIPRCVVSRAPRDAAGFRAN